MPSLRSERRRVAFSPLRSISLRILLTTVLLVVSGEALNAQTETTIVNFPDGTSVINPWTLIPDGKGNFYGTAIGNNGAVFELSPSDGGWALSTVYQFPGEAGPFIPHGIVMDSSGNLYVACTDGPAGSEGSIAEISPDGAGGWTEKTIFLFDGTNGRYPIGGLILDSEGNLYGTTNVGGNCSASNIGCGLAYKLSPQAGTWKQTILYSFGAYSGDGQFPAGGLTFDSKGNLYGTTTGGGLSGCPNSNEDCGTVFELAHTAGGWKEKVIFTPNINQAEYPSAAPTFDSAGNLYVTGYEGGPELYGTVFELTPKASGQWGFHMVHAFDSFTTGSILVGGVTLDAEGNLFVSTADGGKDGNPCVQNNGTPLGCGTVWEFKPAGTNKWTSKLLYVFKGGSDGSQLNDQNLVFDSSGNVYGAATLGGDSNGDGTIFRIKP